MSQEYIGALVIALVSFLKFFNIELATEGATALVTGVVALWVAWRRLGKGDITVIGSRK